MNTYKTINLKEALNVNSFYSTILILIIFITSCQAQERKVTFKVNVNHLDNVENVSIIGDINPIASNAKPLTDLDNDGVYETTITFKTSKRYVNFKFLVNNDEELKGSDKRRLWFKDELVSKSYVYNEYEFYNNSQLDKLVYTNKQLEEDVAILKETLQYIHPNVYGYIDSLSLQKEFNKLELELKNKPTLNNAYGAISKFSAKVKCSHTFTNPWNQGARMEFANFSQPDKIPFTFNRIGKRLFIDKNASDNSQLEKGLEIVSMNGETTQNVLTQLAHYVTSDGNNYEKKLERLLVSGEEKFAMFDMFYPIEYGSQTEFRLELKNLKTNEQIKTTVKATSKTNRTKILLENYGNVSTDLKSMFDFKLLNETTAQLIIKSFAVQSNTFDWKGFLDDAFKTMNTKSISNLIIDIRMNEGGQGVVGKYIFERVIQQPTKINAMESSVRYLEIPKNIKKHISTWDKFPYSFKGKTASSKNGSYLLKEKYSIEEIQLKPKRNGFKGQVYLMTDASNSSATHILAMYAKGVSNITIVGQETGGNQLGTNGSFMFFLRLPNTKIEVDIPVIKQVVPLVKGNVDGGIKPDVVVEKNVMDFVENKDTELSAVLKLINSK